MALTKQDLKVICSLVTTLMNERAAPVAIEGRVAPGSYHPGDGTVEVAIGDSDAAYQLASVLGDASTTVFLSHPRAPIANHDPNDQYGPVGGEAVTLHQTQSGYVAKFHPDAATNDAPGPPPFYSVKAPSGERWIFHRNASGQIDSGMKLTNDGPTNGDGLGGTIVGNKGALTQAQTASGHQVTLDDTAQTLTLKTAGVASGFSITDVLDDIAQTATRTAAPGLYTIWDAAGNALSHVVPTGGGIGMGDLFANLPTSAGAINNDILTTFGDNVNTFGLNNLIQYAQLLQTVGAITSGQLTAMLAALVESWIAKVGVPAGSNVVRIISSGLPDGDGGGPSHP